MLGPKKENRYNAYMKKTESGIIVKTVDSVTGFETLIKFTADSFMGHKEPRGSCSNKEAIRHIRKSVEEKPGGNKKNHTVLKNNPTIISKFSNLRPYLRELQPKIPNFHVYEDESSTLDFKTSKTIFVANSKLAKENVVNLNIPGKLRNVRYRGVLNGNGEVQFEAESIIKPLSLVIGEYVININVCHNVGLIPSKFNIDNKTQQKDKRGLSLSSKNSLELLNKEHNSKDKLPYSESKTNLSNSISSIQNCNTHVNDKTKNFSNSLRDTLESDSSSVIVKSSLACVSEPRLYTQKHYNQSEAIARRVRSHESALGTMKLSQTQESKRELSTSLNQPNNKESYTSTCHSPQTKESVEGDNSSKNCKLSSVEVLPLMSSNNTISDCSDNSHYNPCSGNHSSEFGGNKSSLPAHDKPGTGSTVETDRIPHTTNVGDRQSRSRCSNTSLVEIKKKLSEATISLHKICSVIDSIENSSEKSDFEENPKPSQTEMDGELNNHICVYETHCRVLDEIYSNSSTTIVKNISVEERGSEYLCGDSSTRYTKETNQAHINTTSSKVSKLECEAENAQGEIPISSEIVDTFPTNFTTVIVEPLKRTKYYFGERNSFREMNKGGLKSNNNECKTTNEIKKIGPKLLFHNKRRAQSLTEVFESTKPCCSGVDNNNVHFNRLETSSRTIYEGRLQTSGSNKSEINKHCEKECGTEAREEIPQNKLVNHPQSCHSVDNDILGGSDEKVDTVGLRHKERQGETNSTQGSEESYKTVNSGSKNSIKTIYIKSDCVSSNYLSLPVEESSIQIFEINENKLETNNANISIKPTTEEKHRKANYKDIGKIIKQKLSQLTWNFRSVKHNKKNSDLMQAPGNSKSKVSGAIGSNTVRNKETNGQLIFVASEQKSRKTFNTEGDSLCVEMGDTKVMSGSSITTPKTFLGSLLQTNLTPKKEL